MKDMVKRLLEARQEVMIEDERTPEMDDAAQEIMSACNQKVSEYMMSEGFPEDEVKHYSAVDVSFDRGYDNELMLKVEVRAEVSYEGLEKLCDLLNPIVSYFSPDSYFEPVDAGIIEAWLDAEEASKEEDTIFRGEDGEE